MPYILHNVKYGVLYYDPPSSKICSTECSNTALCLWNREVWIEVLLPYVFYKVEYGVQCYMYPSYIIRSTVCNTGLRLTKFAVRR